MKDKLVGKFKPSNNSDSTSVPGKEDKNQGAVEYIQSTNVSVEATTKSPKFALMKNKKNNYTTSKNTKLSQAPVLHGSKNLPKRKRRIWLRVFLIIVATALIVGSVVTYRTYRSLNRVITKNAGVAAEGLKTENIAPEKLKGECNGRVNILLLGVGDPGNAGEQLSDTIIVASYDPKTHDVAMLSIPRDMYVKISGGGYSKINNAHAFGEQAKKGTGPEVAKQTVSTLLGIPIHYYIRTDFTALSQAVDLVGGVDVTVKEALLDNEYPCMRN